MRTLIQAISLCLFTLLFLFANDHLPPWLAADIYLRLDPLLGLSAVLAGREIIARALWSFMLVGATLLVGRFFCAYICPLGATIDFLDSHLLRKKMGPDFKNEASWRRAKYFFLIVFLSAALAGLSLAYLLDPLSFLTRFFTFFLYPLLITLANLALDLLRPLFQILGWMELAHLHYPQPVYYMALITFLLFATVIALNRWVPRFWCRYLCPLGALLSFLSPLGVFKRRVNSQCNQCGKCRNHCPMGAIPEDPKKTNLGECIQCRTCKEVCPREAIDFPPLPAWKSRSRVGGEYSAVDVSRRGFLYSFTGGLVAAFLVDRAPFTPLRGRRQMIRPPGALPEADFLRTCIRCGECMKSCPTNTLQPCLWEAGPAGLWTPKLQLRLAACEQNCKTCGQVCPTQALRSLSLEEKTHAKVGTAAIHKETCLVWAQDKLCLICDEICPYNAIVFRTVEGYRRPVVIPSRCNGCGFCETKCPVLGESAIIVTPQGEIRLREGSYVKEAKKLELDFKPDPGDDRYIIEKSGLKAGGTEPEEKPSPTEKTSPSQKPKGFL